MKLSLLLDRDSYGDLSIKTLQALIGRNPAPDRYVEEAYLSLARMYSQYLERDDLARFTYEKFLLTFPESENRRFAEGKLRSMSGGDKAPGVERR